MDQIEEGLKANEPKERAPWPLDPSLTDTLRSSDLPGV